MKSEASKRLNRTLKSFESRIKKDKQYLALVENITTLGMREPNITYFITKERTGSYDFIIEYNKEERLYYGVPVTITTEIDDIESTEGAFYSNGIIATYRHVFPVFERVEEIDLLKWPEEIEGIGALGDQEAIQINRESITVPDFIRSFEENSLKGSSCENLALPAHLLGQIARSGIEMVGKGKIELTVTGEFGLNSLSIKKSKGRCTRYIDILEKGENIVVYPKKINIEVHGEEKDFLPGFTWSKFFESSEDMVMGLLLAKYGIVTISDMIQGMLEIYYDIR